MQLPTISQYAGTVADPEGLTRTLGEFTGERDNYGEVKIRTGNNACVFRILHCGRERMLKCYVRPRSDLAAIYDYISSNGDRLFPDIKLLRNELFVFDHFGSGSFYDVVCGEWVDGVTLDTEVGRACREGSRERLAELSAAFDLLAYELLNRDWAHGDLKPENIIVKPDGSLSLIDFDALYFPGNPEPSYLEVGTPGFQHPLRIETLYEKSIDDYPLALISASLRALSLDPSLYERFNRSDMLIMNPADILAGICPAYPEVKKTLADAACFSHYKLTMLLSSASPNIDGLAEIFGRIILPPQCNDKQPEVYMEGGLCGFTDGEGGPKLTDPVFEEACGFREGVALVCLNGTKRLVTDKFAYLLRGNRYEDIKPLSEGVAAVRLDGLWGYVSGKGEMVAEPRFEAAGNMHCGLAPVMQQGLWGYIDRQGRPVTGFLYEKALGYREGEACVYKDGKMLIIDTNGNIMRRKSS